MKTFNRRRFLAFTTAGVVAIAAGGIALTVRQLSGKGQGKTLNFQAVTGLPGKPLLSYASYVIDGSVNANDGTGTITQHVYAGSPESMTSIALFTRVVHVNAAHLQGNVWQVSGVVADPAQLQKGEDSAFTIQLDAASNIAHATFLGSPIQLQLQRFTAS